MDDINIHISNKKEITVAFFSLEIAAGVFGPLKFSLLMPANFRGQPDVGNSDGEEGGGLRTAFQSRRVGIVTVTSPLWWDPPYKKDGAARPTLPTRPIFWELEIVKRSTARVCFGTLSVSLRGKIQFQVTLTKQDVGSSLTGALPKNFRQAYPCIYFLSESRFDWVRFPSNLFGLVFPFNISGGVEEKRVLCTS